MTEVAILLLGWLLLAIALGLVIGPWLRRRDDFDRSHSYRKRL